MIAKWAQEDVETVDNLLNNNNPPVSKIDPWRLNLKKEMRHWKYLLHDTNTDRHTRVLNVLGQLAPDWGIKNISMIFFQNMSVQR